MSSRTETIQIKVTQEQKNKINNFIKQKSIQDGYQYTVSSFLLNHFMKFIDSYFITSGSL